MEDIDIVLTFENVKNLDSKFESIEPSTTSLSDLNYKSEREEKIV